ncbi:MAG: MBL fold metallo-hydrolase [Candidatus Kariarchaeaceae archaeon]
MNLPYIHILGTGQDGGVPQLGCECNNCINAIENPKLKRLVYSIAVVGENNTLLIDATPDIKLQINMLRDSQNIKINKFGTLPISFSVLTHLHYGHYIGILELGQEVASSHKFPVYVSRQVKDFLLENKPFSYLIQRNEIVLRELDKNKWIIMDPTFSIMIFNVPHRNEDGDTIGLLVKNNLTKSVACLISDIDYLDASTKEKLQSSSLVLFDGTFFSKDELPRQVNVPHPPIIDTISEIGQRELGSFYFIHLNHTNPLNAPNSDKNDYLRENGYLVAFDNFKIEF